MNPTPEALIDVLTDQTGIDANEITLETAIAELGLDSLEIVELLMALEEQFETELEEPDLLKCSTVGDILTMIRDAVDFSEPLSTPNQCTDDSCESCQ